MQRVLAAAFTADARFVLSGSDDGNVRVWKANASEKLGIVTARERSAIEYRNALKERWKMDAEIGKVQRYAHSCLINPAVLYSNIIIDYIGVGIYRNPCTRLGSSNGRCKRQTASRRNGAGGIRARARANPRRHGRKWSSRNRANILYYRYVVTFPSYMHGSISQAVDDMNHTAELPIRFSEPS
jgi:hypothetical protein